MKFQYNNELKECEFVSPLKHWNLEHSLEIEN